MSACLWAVTLETTVYVAAESEMEAEAAAFDENDVDAFDLTATVSLVRSEADVFDTDMGELVIGDDEDRTVAEVLASPGFQVRLPFDGGAK